MICVWSYESSAVGDVRAHLLDIARAGERRNATAQVSGVLGYDVYGFYQVLEGRCADVGALRRLILRDRRHRVNWECIRQVDARRMPMTLPIAFLATEIPHGAILRPGNDGVPERFEAFLLDRAAEKYPRSYAHQLAAAG
ncbi:MAG: BLUF domain-containing protein [Roseicyclus sp.]